MDHETKLIRRIQKHSDRAAADALVRAYYDEILRYTSRQITQRADALDITQNIFVSMLQTICHYDQSRAGFRTWLYHIATNRIVDFFRSNAKHANALPIPDECGWADADDFESRIAQDDLVERVCSYVDGLAADAQRVFRLKFFGGCTFAEIAQTLGIPEATAKTRYYRLIQTLRKEFRDAWD